MRFPMFLSSIVVCALVSIAPGALAAEWGVSENATFSIDATVSHTATPDYVNMTVECQILEPLTREQIRVDRAEKLAKLAVAAGSSVKVRSMGTPMLNQFQTYDEQGQPVKSDAMTYNGNFGFSMELKAGVNAEQLSKVAEEIGCTFMWDPRVVQTAKYARQYRSELIKQINERKAFYEELLGVTLNRVTNISMYSNIESPYTYYMSSSSYIPEENSVMVQTTMTVSFDVPSNSKKN